MTVPGRLVLVATPIGNLGDLSPRAVEALRTADVVCCEDTRRTRQLLTHAEVTGQKLVSFHEHNEAQRTVEVLEWLRAGRTVALVSDAGTPALSDPGQRVVAAAAEAGAVVTVVPGPNAALAALVASGLPTDRFCFEGFLPRRGAERRQRLDAVSSEHATVLLHETAPRLAATLADLVDLCGDDRRVAVARELTKVHEELWRGRLADAVHEFSSRPVRGEIVVVLEGAPEGAAPTDDVLAEALRHRLAAGATLRDASAGVAAELGVARRRVYEIGLAERARHGMSSDRRRLHLPTEEEP